MPKTTIVDEDGDEIEVEGLDQVRAWAQVGDTFNAVDDVQPTLGPGAYTGAVTPNRGPYLERMKLQVDQLLDLPDPNVDRLLEEFRAFWKLEHRFREHGYLHKRGLLMWGPPGGGKTSAIHRMSQALIRDHGGIVLFIQHPTVATMCLAMIRKVEPTRPIVTVMEDLETLVAHHGDHGFLALLDGETQISGVCHIATTNYPERLDLRFTDRPSRFDTIIEVGMPGYEAREAYFRAKTDEDQATIRRWAERSEGFSIAHLREVIIAIRVFGQTEDDCFERLARMRTVRPNSKRRKSNGQAKWSIYGSAPPAPADAFEEAMGT